jgi:diguanylate cyclase (GGDEF)-like protein
MSVASRRLTGNAQDRAVTVSIGVAWIPTVHRHTASSLITNADAALYRAKEQGRNKVEYWPMNRTS